MGFNEKTHAFIAAYFYKYMVERFGQRGKEAFIHATICYAEGRGRRMAQRAIRDGRPLNYGTYMEYGEWEPSGEEKENTVKTASLAPDYEIDIYSCPWHDMFMELGLKEAGITYCSVLDRSICRGFNPDLTYLVPQTLYNSPCCIQKVINSGLKEGESHKKRMEYVKDFAFHTAHSFYTYKEVCEAIFKEEGKLISDKIFADFKERYGDEMAEVLESFKNTNFNVC